MPDIMHIPPGELIVDSFALGRKIYESGFIPDHAISLWRGGTPIGLGVHSFFRMQGIWFNHTTVATHSYTGIQQHSDVIVKNLDHVIKCLCPEDRLLIIDDIYESGNTINKIISIIRQKARSNFPENILVATVHAKPEKFKHHHDLTYLKRIDPEVWIDYPHELSDLVGDNGDISRISEKDPEIAEILAQSHFPVEKIERLEPYYVSYKELLYDSFRLGVNIYHDESFFPDFIIALWPGGIWSGLPIHEVFKYYLKKDGKRAGQRKMPDHIAISTTDSHLSYKSNIIGCQYLEDHVNKTDNILIIDSTFRSGRVVNDTIDKLKASLRRNLNHKRIKVAAIYYNPNDKSTWISKPVVEKPDYYLREVNCEIVYPTSIHKIKDPRRKLKALKPELHEILY